MRFLAKIESFDRSFQAITRFRWQNAMFASQTAFPGPE